MSSPRLTTPSHASITVVMPSSGMKSALRSHSRTLLAVLLVPLMGAAEEVSSLSPANLRAWSRIACIDTFSVASELQPFDPAQGSGRPVALRWCPICSTSTVDTIALRSVAFARAGKDSCILSVNGREENPASLWVYKPAVPQGRWVNLLAASTYAENPNVLRLSKLFPVAVDGAGDSRLMNRRWSLPVLGGDTLFGVDAGGMSTWLYQGARRISKPEDEEAVTTTVEKVILDSAYDRTYLVLRKSGQGSALDGCADRQIVVAGSDGIAHSVGFINNHACIDDDQWRSELLQTSPSGYRLLAIYAKSALKKGASKRNGERNVFLADDVQIYVRDVAEFPALGKRAAPVKPSAKATAR